MSRSLCTSTRCWHVPVWTSPSLSERSDQKNPRRNSWSLKTWFPVFQSLVQGDFLSHFELLSSVLRYSHSAYCDFTTPQTSAENKHYLLFRNRAVFHLKDHWCWWELGIQIEIRCFPRFYLKIPASKSERSETRRMAAVLQEFIPRMSPSKLISSVESENIQRKWSDLCRHDIIPHQTLLGRVLLH